MLSVDAGTAYDHNPRFLDPAGTPDVANRIEATLGHAGRVGRSQWQLVARGEAVRQRAMRELDRLVYDAGLDGLIPMTPRLTAKLSGVYRVSWTPDVALGGLGADAFGGVGGVGGGVGGIPPMTRGLPLLPVSQSRSIVGGSSVAYRLSPAVAASLSASASHVTFDASALAGGSAWAAAAVLVRQYGPAATVGGSYDVQRTVLDSSQTDVHTLSLNWAPAIGRARLGVRLGASLTAPHETQPMPARGAGDMTLRQTGEVTLRVPMGGSRSAQAAGTLRAARGVSQPFGLGTVLYTDQAAAGYERLRPDGTGVRLSVDQAWSRDSQGGQPPLALTALQAEVRRAVFGNTWLGVGAFARRRSQSGVVVDGGGLTLGVGRTLAW